MIYEFVNKDTGETIEEDFSPQDIPSFITRAGKRFYRNWGSTAIKIPFQWNEHAKRNDRYGKSPSGKKHYW